MLSMLVASSSFTPTPVLRPQRSPARAAVAMIDPGFVDAAGMIGRASTFGLACWAVAQVVDPPHTAYERHLAATAADQPDEAAKRFGWLNADMSVPLPTLQDLEDSCVRVGQQRGCAASLAHAALRQAASRRPLVASTTCARPKQPARGRLACLVLDCRSTFYLCKQKSEGFRACEVSHDFSQYYGESVYVCRA